MRRRLTGVVASVVLLGAMTVAVNPGVPLAAGKHLCPREVPAAHRFDADRVEGKRLPRARALAGRHDCTVRVVRLDGVLLPTEDTYVPNRINVGVRDEQIRRVTGIG